MANKKFSQFTSTPSVDQSTGYLVGYDSTLNVNTRFTAGQLRTSLGLDINYILSLGGVFTDDRTIDQNVKNFEWQKINMFYLGTNDGDYALTINSAAHSVQLGDTGSENVFLTGGNMAFYIDNSAPNEKVYSKYYGSNIGVVLDFANGVYTLGDEDGYYGGNASSFRSNCNNSNSSTQIHTYNSSLDIDIATYQDSALDKIYTVRNGSEIGSKFDFSNQLYYFGDFNSALGSNSYFYINGVAKELIIETNQVNFNSPSMQSGSSGGSSGQHLVVYVGGVQYKIALLNP
jgi:hypothetical protein